MKNYLIMLLAMLTTGLAQAQHQTVNTTFTDVGLVSNNAWLMDSLSKDPNYRVYDVKGIEREPYKQLADGTYGHWTNRSGKLIEEELNKMNVGKLMLDAMLHRQSGKLDYTDISAPPRYTERAAKALAEESQDAETEAKLLDELRKNRMKTNYVVIFTDMQYELLKSKVMLFRVEITDEIIEQVYMNSYNLSAYDKIKVPVKYVTTIKTTKEHALADFGKHEPTLAVRGRVLDRHPFLVEMTKSQGMRKNDRVFIYRNYMDVVGNDTVSFSKKVCTARVTKVTGEDSRLYTISGKVASGKLGDVAVRQRKHGAAWNYLFGGSLGGDARLGFRLMGDHLLSFHSSGFADYFVWSLDMAKYSKEPEGVWTKSNGESVRPSLIYGALNLGYGKGYNFLGRFEVMPYLMAGLVIHTRSHELFQKETEDGYYFYGNPIYYPKVDDSNPFDADLQGIAGAKFSMNIWYPLQLTGAIDYNHVIRLDKESNFAPAVDGHTLSRVNIYIGLRARF